MKNWNRTNTSLLSCPIVSCLCGGAWWCGRCWRRRRNGQHQRTHPRGMLVHPAASELNTQPVHETPLNNSSSSPSYVHNTCIHSFLSLILFFVSEHHIFSFSIYHIIDTTSIHYFLLQITRTRTHTYVHVEAFVLARSWIEDPIGRLRPLLFCALYHTNLRHLPIFLSLLFCFAHRVCIQRNNYYFLIDFS